MAIRRRQFAAPHPVAKRERDKRFPAGHPANSWKNHNKLLEYVTDRLDFGSIMRDDFVDRLEAIDKELAAFTTLSKADRKRERDILNGKAVAPTQIPLPLADAQIDEIVTYLLSVFVPDSDVFMALGQEDIQSAANALVGVMNNNAKNFKYVREYSIGFRNAIKYNLGGFIVEWESMYGNVITDNAGKAVVKKKETIYAGNSVEAIDLYNFIWDRSVHPVDLACKGEFFAVVKPMRRFTWEKLKQVPDNKIFNKEQVDAANANSIAGIRYYKTKPKLRTNTNLNGVTETSGEDIDWTEILSQGKTKTLGGVMEFVYVYMWLVPKDFGLSSSTELEIWRITLCNGQWIVEAEHMNNAHGMLPCAFASPLEDNMELEQKAISETLLPIQRFGSFLLNTHMAAMRKSIWGITVYDPSMVDMNVIEDDVSARIPMKPAGYGKDVRTAVQSWQDAPNTDKTLTTLGELLQIMQLLFPTQRTNQMTDLQRATQYQAAQTIQSSNKRNLKLAKLMHDQMMMDMRRQMIYNILEFQQPTTIPGPNGTNIQVNPAQLRTANLEFVIGEGLQSLDRMTVANAIRELINAVLQSPSAFQEIDIVKLLAYGARLNGEKIDLEKFRRQVPLNSDGQPQSAPPGPGAVAGPVAASGRLPPQA